MSLLWDIPGLVLDTWDLVRPRIVGLTIILTAMAVVAWSEWQWQRR